MRYEINGKLCKIATTFHEYVQLANEFKADDYGSMYRTKGNCEFYGDANTFEQMYDRCYDGYNAKAIGEQRRKIAELFQSERPTDEMRVSGEALDVPTYLSGDPKCFWESTTEQRKARVHIAYSTNCVAGVNAESFLNHGGAMAVLCDLIADEADTKISLYVSNTHVYGGKGLNTVTIKEYDEAVDIPRIGATTHPSFFRRIGFAWFEGFGPSIGKPQSWVGTGCSQTGKDRARYVVSDEEFSEWLRIDNDEIVVDLPAADLPVFRTEERTADWLASAVDTLLEGIKSGNKHITLFH